MDQIGITIIPLGCPGNDTSHEPHLCNLLVRDEVSPSFETSYLSPGLNDIVESKGPY